MSRTTSRQRHARRRSRIALWEGHILAIDPDSVCIRLALVSPVSPKFIYEIVAEFPPSAFSRTDAANMREGSYVTLYTHRRGRKVRTVLRLKRFRPWTEAELAAIRARAAERAAELAALAER